MEPLGRKFSNQRWTELILKSKLLPVSNVQVNLVAASNSSDNATSSNATDTGTAESDGSPQMVMVPSPDYMTLEMPPYGQVKAFFNVYLLFNRRTNGLEGDQSAGIASSTSTRTLAPTISSS